MEWLDTPVYQGGGVTITVGRILFFVVALVALYVVSGWLRAFIAKKLLSRSKMEPGTREAIGSIVRYVVLFVGLLVAIQAAGIDLTSLTVFAGAIGIGVGFGLQDLANNFLSGLVLLVERPVKTGDRVEIGDVHGRVAAINARSTTVVTNDNIAIIVPNSKLTSENVVNWSYNDQRIRFRVPVSVAYGSDLREVERLLVEVAKEDPDVLDDPAPSVRLIQFGGSGIDFELRAWSSTLIQRKGLMISNLLFRIYDKFAAHGIELPLPQMEVQFRGAPLEVSQGPLSDEGANDSEGPIPRQEP